MKIENHNVPGHPPLIGAALSPPAPALLPLTALRPLCAQPDGAAEVLRSPRTERAQPRRSRRRKDGQ